MICPNCRCEYREGFQHCSDCNVELVNELPQVEENKNQREPLRHPKIGSNKKYYFLNGILGFVGSPLFLLFSTIAATQSQRLPPNWGEQSKANTSSLFIMLLFLMIIIAVNIMGIISFTRKNKATGSYGVKLLKFILLNFVIFVASFVAFILIGSIFLKF